MKRWIAAFLLVVVATFVSAYGADHCEDRSGAHHQRAQHLLCVDDCAPALIAHPPTPPPADPMPRLVYKQTVIRPILTIDLEPEKEPPRA